MSLFQIQFKYLPLVIGSNIQVNVWWWYRAESDRNGAVSEHY